MEHALLEAMKESLIDHTYKSNSNYGINIITNNGDITLTVLKEQLQNCDEFLICVAFASLSGIMPFKMMFHELAKNDIKGKIILGNMNNFTSPDAIRALMNFENIELRLNTDGKLHTKGYFFRKGNMWTIIVGSSNLTMSAMRTNNEWNIKLNSLNDGRTIKQSLAAFEYIWKKSAVASAVIEEYAAVYDSLEQQKLKYKQHLQVVELITPNKMQLAAMNNLHQLRMQGAKKAIVISATGTGKTYLSAFDVKNEKPLRCLFIVHRENIAKKAMETFSSVIGDKTMALYNGKTKGKADYLFATIQTFSKDQHLQQFSKTAFDYIIIDEVHHSGATTYKKLMNYFKPKFMLGMSATPERTDNVNIFELFDHNIAYEIRLNAAINNNLVVPFHYFGIAEMTLNGLIINPKSNISFSQRARLIKESSKLYGYDGKKVKGLIFIDTVEKAYKLSEALNSLGYQTVALSASDSEAARNDAIKKLESNTEEYLDFIITVDIFNEGIDIPSINQVILMRPTNSAIVYVQQLGRGLRKNKGKKFLTVIDFIGNYDNNFLVPVALSGNNSYDAHELNMFVSGGIDEIPGNCSVSFDKIAKDVILQTIKPNNFSKKAIIMSDYKIIKSRVGRRPMLVDFIEQNVISPEFVLKYENTYIDVIEKIDKTEQFCISECEYNYIAFLQKELSMGKRVHEFLILKYLLKDNYDVNQLNQKIEEYLNIAGQMVSTKNAWMHLEKSIFNKLTSRYGYRAIIERNQLVKEFKDSYLNNDDFKLLVDDTIKANITYIEKYYKQLNMSPLLIGHSYERKEIFQLLNMDFNNADIQGYKIDKDKNIVMILMKIDKSSFNNELISRNEIKWYSQNHKTLEKNENERNIKDNLYTLEIFVKKQEKEKGYYLGKATSLTAKNTFNDSGVPVIEYILQLDDEISLSVWDYFNS